MFDFFRDRKILVCVTGGIAAYKTLDIVSNLRKCGADIRVVMTRNACRFVTPLSFEAVSGARVYYDMWDRNSHDIDHISLKDFPDITIVAPASADIIGKFTSCIADDLLSTTLLGIKTPIFFFPSMNTDMYDNVFFRECLNKLKNNGYHVVEPDEGHLACGVSGKGRMPSCQSILQSVESALSDNLPLKGKKVMITLGATREYFDKARFLSNPSTGKMGASLAGAFRKNGAEVIVVAAHNEVDLSGFDRIDVVSAVDMYEAVTKNISGQDIFVATAAVCDFRPTEVIRGKIKKHEQDLSSTVFSTNPDILKDVCAMPDRPPLCVGFAAEAESVEENGRKKLMSKKADIIVANSITDSDGGFASDDNKVLILTETHTESLGPDTKYNIAEGIVGFIADVLNNKN
ncbi:MAG: bifunctional phosphopantothenoylcysteine decarboxylase/phosphopantothenate--cysteine ligase CoaBC [Candidatus Muiribacteriaceae bacterium]